MAANTVLNTGAGGDTIRTLDKTTYKTPVSAIDLGGTGAESLLVAGQAAMAGSIPVVIANNQSGVSVTGTFWQATQPVSGTFWQATQPISAAALPLPSGASTAAKQPALGTAGSASADVISIQGIASMTKLLVDGSAVTQPVSGTVTVGTQPVRARTTDHIGAASMTDAIMNGLVALTPKFAYLDATASGATQIVAGVSTKKIRVLRYSVYNDATAVNVYFKSATAGQISSTKRLAANSAASGAFCQVGHFETTAGEALQINLSGAVNTGIDVVYVEV